MADNYNWCHGPSCHEKKTQDRIRGVKGHKVLRTRKVTWSRFYNPNNPDCWWMFFCSTHCRDQYINKHIRAIIALEPRPEPLETRCEVVETKRESTMYNWKTDKHEPYTYKTKDIRVLDNTVEMS